MSKVLTIKFGKTDRKVGIILLGFVFLFVILTITQDLLRSNVRNSGFYFSESFMFSSFWWLFAPLLFAQWLAIKNPLINRIYFKMAVIGLPILIHVFFFPSLVWLISRVFYYHNFSFQQTLRYTLSEHVYLLLIFYSMPVLAFSFFIKNKMALPEATEISTQVAGTAWISSFLVSEGNKKYYISVSDILYFSASSPYIYIHVDGKKYLHHETLRSVSLKLNPAQFVRVHKSTIINIEMVDTCCTRFNGDYDLTIKNNEKIRVSRNFAADFKNLFKKTHQLTTK